MNTYFEQELLNLLDKGPLTVVDILDYRFETFTPNEKLYCLRNLIDRGVLILEKNIIMKKIDLAV